MAEPEATEQYFKRLSHKNIHPDAIRSLGKTEFRVSCIGFGGYRIHHNSIEHAKALRYALLNGFNLIDTSSNYTDGGSEMLTGNILQEMFDRKELAREEVVVVSKVGYVQGQNLKIAHENEDHGHPFPDMVKYMDGCWHCVHPDFLQDQLSRSLERLQIPALDVYLLHNPEYFLSDQKKRNQADRETAHEIYYSRIKRAFEWMEEKVAEGKIKAYGISSNTFVNAVKDFEFTAFDRTLQIAEEVASKNYFRVIQFPFNILETGAYFEKNQLDGSKTLLQLAAEKQIGTLVNRPLNAMSKNGMVRLASFRETDPTGVQNAAGKTLKSLAKLETQFANELTDKVSGDIPKKTLLNVFSVSQHLKNALSGFENWEHWDHVKQNMVMPQVFSHLHYLNNKYKSDNEWQQWSDSYAKTLMEFLDAVSRHYENQAQKRSQDLGDKITERAPELEQAETLSQKALRVLTSTKGIDCVLLGMRKTPYVEDAVEVLRSADVTKESVVKALGGR